MKKKKEEPIEVLEITKVQYMPTVGLRVEWDGQTDNGDKQGCCIEDSDNPHPELHKAMKALLHPAVLLFGIPKEVANEYMANCDVQRLIITREEGKSPKATIRWTKKVEGSDTEAVGNSQKTPFTPPESNPDGACLSKPFLKAINTVAIEATRYVNGDRPQMALPDQGELDGGTDD